MIVARSFVFLDDCQECVYRKYRKYNDYDFCYRCPIACCGRYQLCKPEDFNEDCAKAYHDWFGRDCVGVPDIHFTISEKKGGDSMSE